MAAPTRTTSPPPGAPHRRVAPAEQPPSLRVGPPPRQRRPALITGAVLLVLVFAALNAALYLKAGQRTEVIAVAREVPAGRKLVVEDLTRVRITPDPNLQTIPVSAAADVVGKPAATRLLPGTLLTYQQLRGSQVPAAGQAVAGLDLKGAQMPVPADQLQPGTVVRLVTTPGPGGGDGASAGVVGLTGTVLVEQAQVVDVAASDTGDSIHVAVVVQQSALPAVLRAAAAGQVAIGVLPAGGATPTQP
jgi:SAF domain